MPRLPSPLEDVFEKRPSQKLVPPHELPSFKHLLGTQIVAADGTQLGTISTNKYDAASIANKYGTFGSKYSATCILNQYGRYGGKYSNLSPFNQYTSTPPRVVQNGKVIAHLTKNRYVANPIDPDELVAWLGLET